MSVTKADRTGAPPQARRVQLTIDDVSAGVDRCPRLSTLQATVNGRLMSVAKGNVIDVSGESWTTGDRPDAYRCGLPSAAADVDEPPQRLEILVFDSTARAVVVLARGDGEEYVVARCEGVRGHRC